MPFWRCKLILFLMIGALVSVSCCTKNQPSSPPSYSQPSRQESPSSSNEPTVTPPPVTPTNRIRTIDFRNFTYHWYPKWDYSASTRSTVVLKDGVMEVNAPSEGNEPRSFEFVNVAYADLTGDDREEAVVTLSIRSGGTSRTHCIFVYTLSGESPELLWVHETGDRAVEGLRNAYIQDRSLVIEQYDPLFGNTAKTFTRSYYQWSAKSFRILRTEKIPNDLKDGEPRVLLKSSGR